MLVLLKTINNFYELELKERKGEIMRLSELDLDFSFALVDDARTMFVHHLVNSGKAKLYFGIQTNSTITQQVKDEIGEVVLFNEVKEKGAEMDLSKVAAGIKNEEEFKEKFEQQAQEVMDKFKEEVKNSVQKKAIKIHKDEFLLLPSDVDIKEYQKVLDKVNELGSIYGESMFVEIL